MSETTYDLVIIGAGPAGYVGAVRAAQLGLRVACVEKEPELGGTCLQVGCIPSKALLDSSERYHETLHGLKAHGIAVSGVELDLPAMMARKSKIVAKLSQEIPVLFKKHGIEHSYGTAGLVEPGVVRVDGEQQSTIRSRHILIATGSVPAGLPGIEWQERIGTSTEALAFPEVPRRLIVIGGGAIGLELGSVWRRLGAEVTVLEYLDHILPGSDAEIAQLALRAFKKQRIGFKLEARVQSAVVENDECIVRYNDTEELRGDRVLVAVGRRPLTDGLNLAAVGIDTDGRGFIPVDRQFQTKVPGIYAVGDVIGGALLAHKASQEAIACVEQIATGVGWVNYDTLPNVVYTAPEVAGVGQTEEQLVQNNVPFQKGQFVFRSNGRARILGQTEGVIKILAHQQTDRVLGVHIIGPRAGDLIAEASVAMEYGASSEDIARAWHAHPSLAETIKEAALDVDSRALHA